MFAIAFDLIVKEAEASHPRGVAQAYQDIANELSRFAFVRVQGSVYVTQSDDLGNLFQAIMTLKALSWFPGLVRDIRAFKVEHWSDFTTVIIS
jgi:virulence-associated protein VapD